MRCYSKQPLITLEEQHLWCTTFDFTQFISAGAEQKVYLNGEKEVLKLNDAIYYASWLDYFYNLLLNNYFKVSKYFHIFAL